MGLRINVGCGATPTVGWLNLDNSPTVLLARAPLVADLLVRAGFLSGEQARFVSVVRDIDVRYANAARHIPVAPGSADVVYSSHMLEHLDPLEAEHFLRDVLRVLAPGGTLRLALPDLRRLVDRYAATGDADEFIASTHMPVRRPRRLRERLGMALQGHRQHCWMYDATSLVRLLTRLGFIDAQELPVGKTTIPEPGALDLRERESESVYVEARKGSQA